MLATTAQRAMMNLREAERVAFEVSIEKLPTAEKKSKRAIRRKDTLAQRQSNRAEREAFKQSLLGLSQKDKKNKHQERKMLIQTKCAVARTALDEAARVAYVSTLDDMTDQERETKWLERRATIHKWMEERRVARRENKDVKKPASVELIKNKKKFDESEAAAFEAKMKGLSPAAKKIKWQARINDLRADIVVNGVGGGNRKALRRARAQRDAMARRAAVAAAVLKTKQASIPVNAFANISIADETTHKKKDGMNHEKKEPKTGKETLMYNLATFQASLKGLELDHKKKMWQAVIMALRGHIQMNGAGGGTRKALRFALQMKKEVIQAENQLATVSDEDTVKSTKMQITYDIDELYAFLASLDGLNAAQKKAKWQYRIRKLRLDIESNGAGRGNRKALRFARQEKNKLVRRSFMSLSDKRLPLDEKAPLKSEFAVKKTITDDDNVNDDEEDMVVVDCLDFVELAGAEMVGN